MAAAAVGAVLAATVARAMTSVAEGGRERVWPPRSVAWSGLGYFGWPARAAAAAAAGGRGAAVGVEAALAVVVVVVTGAEVCRPCLSIDRSISMSDFSSVRVGERAALRAPHRDVAC